jgi:hypothetical protein
LQLPPPPDFQSASSPARPKSARANPLVLLSSLWYGVTVIVFVCIAGVKVQYILYIMYIDLEEEAVACTVYKEQHILLFLPAYSM